MARSVWNLFQKTVDFCTFFLNVWALYVQESQYKKNLKYVRTSTCLIQSSLRKIAGRVVLYEKKGTCNKTTTFRVLQNPKIILQFFFGIRLVSRSSPNVLTLIKSSWGTFWKAENQTNCYLEKKCWFNPPDVGANREHSGFTKVLRDKWFHSKIIAHFWFSKKTFLVKACILNNFYSYLFAHFLVF